MSTKINGALRTRHKTSSSLVADRVYYINLQPFRRVLFRLQGQHKCSIECRCLLSILCAVYCNSNTSTFTWQIQVTFDNKNVKRELVTFKRLRGQLINEERILVVPSCRLDAFPLSSLTHSVMVAPCRNEYLWTLLTTGIQQRKSLLANRNK